MSSSTEVTDATPQSGHTGGDHAPPSAALDPSSSRPRSRRRRFGLSIQSKLLIMLLAGVRPDHILFIVSGHASLLVEAAGGRIKFGTAEPGDYTGQTALTRERALSTAVAADLLTVLVVPLATLDTLVGSRPLLASEIGTSIELKRKAASEALATAGVARGLLTPY